VAQGSRVELHEPSREAGFDFQGQGIKRQYPAIRGLGWIIRAGGFTLKAFFGNQLENWLEEVDVQA
jgi:hypothetical protein